MLRKFINFLTPTFIGYSYTKKTIDTGKRVFDLHLLDEHYKFLGLTITNESFGFDTISEMQNYMIVNNITLIN